MALSFLRPQRAPWPPLPALWYWSVERQAQRTSLSPAGPMDSVLASASKSWRMASSISEVLRPQYFGCGRQELDDVVPDGHDHRLGGLALDDDGVVARELHLRGERAADVAVVEDAGSGALAAHDEARRRAHVRPGERPGHEDDGALRGPRVDLRRHLFPHVAQEQALAADVLLSPLHVERLDDGGARAQVDPEHFALVEVQCVLLTVCSIPLRGSSGEAPQGRETTGSQAQPF